MKKRKSRIEKTIILTTISSSAGLPAALCFSCAKRSVPPVSRWSFSGIVVLRIAVRCLHYSQPRIVIDDFFL
ncbi:hypothetical protein AYI68_g1891 [Smittium mucronatum]|uniref:Uncharacterized protein n=1 Tax=Smittium mucronatum TaxID=133383 RepID=A0A1R0H489_9FUNG|nr:hypothetical protein AYI68_g1891 [Smittium mucronatum]